MSAYSIHHCVLTHHFYILIVLYSLISVILISDCKIQGCSGHSFIRHVIHSYWQKFKMAVTFLCSRITALLQRQIKIDPERLLMQRRIFLIKQLKKFVFFLLFDLCLNFPCFGVYLNASFI